MINYKYFVQFNTKDDITINDYQFSGVAYVW